MLALPRQKPWILIATFVLAEFWHCVTQEAPSFVFGTLRLGLASTKRTSLFARTGELNFNLEPVLQAAQAQWGRLFEQDATGQLGSQYLPVLHDDKFDINMGKRGKLDFLGLGSGIQAWEAFAKNYQTHMREATHAKLQKPHFLIAEIGLTTQTLIKKFKDKAKSLVLLQTFVDSVEASGLNAVKCIVYDGADAADFTKYDEARRFLDEGGVLVNIPYLSAETVLAKFNETSKLKEEIVKLREVIERTATAGEYKAIWVRRLQKDGDTFKEIGAAFQVKGDLKNVDDLKDGIERKAKLSIAASKISIYSKSEDAEWVEEEPDAEINSGASKTDCYGFTLPST